MQWFAFTVLSIFALIGFVHFVPGIIRGLTRSPQSKEIILIEPIKASDNAEYLLRSAAGKVMWMGRFAPDRVAVLDCGMDDETRKICSLVCGDYPFMELCSRDELKERIEKI